MRAVREPVRCWQCGADAPDLFCAACGALQPLPARADHFHAIGLPRHLVIDAQALQRQYYDLSRRLHPDVYQTGPAAARSASLQNTAALNRAYRTLRDPVARGLYWLTLHGESLGSNNNRVPPELAALVFDIQEKLDELRANRTSQAVKAEVATAHDELLQRQAALLRALEDNFVRWDTAAADDRELLGDLKSVLSALAYLGTLIRDVERELEN